MRRLTGEEFAAARASLTGPAGEELCLSVFDLALGLPARGGESVMAEVESLGWYSQGQFSALGNIIKDPLREYGFWLERERALPSEDYVPVLNRQRFAGKRLLELGSGGGCNLLSLSGIPAELKGLEPMPVYIQVMSILAEMAGVLPRPTFD